MGILTSEQIERLNADLKAENEAAEARAEAERRATQEKQRVGFDAGVEKANNCSLKELRELVVEPFAMRHNAFYSQLRAEHGGDYACGFAAACREALAEFNSPKVVLHKSPTY